MQTTNEYIFLTCLIENLKLFFRLSNFSQDLNKKISNKYNACEAHSIKMGSQAYLSCALRLRIVRTLNS